MTQKELAASFDEKDQPCEAAWAYELSIQRGDSDLDEHLNLAVLYFTCTDFGYATHKGLDPEFVVECSDRSQEILDLAEERFGSHPEIEFWRRYIRFVELGEEHFEAKALALAATGETLVPYFYLFAYLDENRFRNEAEELMNLTRDGSTARKRYVRSILAGKLGRVGAAQQGVS